MGWLGLPYLSIIALTGYHMCHISWFFKLGKFFGIDEVGIMEKQGLLENILSVLTLLSLRHFQNIIPNLFSYTSVLLSGKCIDLLIDKAGEALCASRPLVRLLRLCASPLVYRWTSPYGYKFGQYLFSSSAADNEKAINELCKAIGIDSGEIVRANKTEARAMIDSACRKGLLFWHPDKSSRSNVTLAEATDKTVMMNLACEQLRQMFS